MWDLELVVIVDDVPNKRKFHTFHFSDPTLIKPNYLEYQAFYEHKQYNQILNQYGILIIPNEQIDPFLLNLGYKSNRQRELKRNGQQNKQEVRSPDVLWGLVRMDQTVTKGQDWEGQG